MFSIQEFVEINEGGNEKQEIKHQLPNLHELAYDLDGFVKSIRTFPNLVVICGLEKLL